MASFYCSTEALIKTRSTSHGGGMHEPSLYPGLDAVDVFEAPHETTGDVGFTSKALPPGLQIYRTLMSTSATSHECSAKDACCNHKIMAQQIDLSD